MQLSVGIALLGCLAFAAVAAPWISPCDPSAISQGDLLMAPSPTHIMGTDSLGRDLFSRLLYGSRISLSVGLVAVGIATLIGLLLGAIAGYYGGIIDAVVMRCVDTMLCFPTIFLLLALAATLEPSTATIMVTIGITSWMGTCRLVRAEILSLKEREFVQAAVAMGASHWRIVTRHLLPNSLGPVLVNVTLSISSAILIESSLSFLGLGVQPPTPSWGNILIESRSTMAVAWWITVFPGLAIFITLISFNMIAEGLKMTFGYAE